MTKLTAIIAAGALSASLGLSTIQPAKADTTSTETILAGAALLAGLAIDANVSHKNALANQIQGYTRNGATVYADGHVVLPNGQTVYPGNQGDQISCNGQQCTITGPGSYVYNGNYGNNGYGYNNGYGNGGYGYNNGYSYPAGTNYGYNNGYNNGYGYPASGTRRVTINRTVEVNRPAREVIVRNVVREPRVGRERRIVREARVAREGRNRN